MALDERLERELDRAARPADPTGVYEDLIRRRERLRLRRRVSAGAIAFAVFVGGAVGLYTLSRAIGDDHPRPANHGALGGRLLSGALDLDYLVDGMPERRLTSSAPDGTDAQDITPPSIDEALYPTASPDGSRIAFFGYVAEKKDHAVYVSNADGTNAERILPMDRQHQIQALAWSPDGSRIGMVMIEFVPVEPPTATGARDEEWVQTIWTIAPDGSDLRQVTTVGREIALTWSPDGRRIAFERTAPIDRTQSDVPTDLYVVDVDGNDERRITHDGVAIEPSWSPDGSAIAYVRQTSLSGGRLSLVAPDGSEDRTLPTGAFTTSDPTWAPDGSTIAYFEFSGPDQTCRIATIRPDGTGHDVSTVACPNSETLWWSPSPPLSVEPTGATAPTGSTSTGRDGTIDLGLGYPVCDVTSVGGVFSEDVHGTAYVFTDAPSGCPRSGKGMQHLGVDFTNDGTIELTADPDGCDPSCTVFAAPDVDGDGTDEVFVQNIQSSIAGLRLFDVAVDQGGVFVRPVTVAGPGYPGEGLPAGIEPQFFIGGDGFTSTSLRCDANRSNQVLIQTSAALVPPDDPSSVWDATATSYLLLPDSRVDVVGVEHFQESNDGRPRSWAQPRTACGARVPSVYAGD